MYYMYLDKFKLVPNQTPPNHDNKSPFSDVVF